MSELREALTRDLNALRAAASRGPVSSREIFQMTDPMMDRLSRAALAAAHAPNQPERIMCSRCDGSGYEWAVGNCPDCTGDGWVNTPTRPDVDEREAMVRVIARGMANCAANSSMVGPIADALLSAGWTRKQEEK